jgi:hypothetical protein
MSGSRNAAISLARIPVARNNRIMAASRRLVKSFPGRSVELQSASTSSGASSGTGTSSSLGGAMRRIGALNDRERLPAQDTVAFTVRTEVEKRSEGSKTVVGRALASSLL